MAIEKIKLCIQTPERYRKQVINILETYRRGKPYIAQDVITQDVSGLPGRYSVGSLFALAMLQGRLKRISPDIRMELKFYERN